jgi:hypothetical protein
MAGRPDIRWADLSNGQRKLLIAAAAAEATFKLAALIDIQRRRCGAPPWWSICSARCRISPSAESVLTDVRPGGTPRSLLETRASGSALAGEAAVLQVSPSAAALAPAPPPTRPFA